MKRLECLQRVASPLGLAAALAAAALAIAGCATDLGGDFFADKHSNLTLRGFQTVQTGTTGGTTGGTSQGSSTARFGGTEGPDAGNPTEFVVRFDPFPNGAALLIQRKTPAINIEVTFRGHDSNNNPIQIVSFLPASGEPDVSATSGGTTGSSATATTGEPISTLRPVLNLQATPTSTTITQSTTGTTSETNINFQQTGTAFPSTVGARFTITNGISARLTSITLRYFELDGSLANISAYTNVLNEFLVANPLGSSFSSTR
ncbi:MAG: hypothetical protein HY814_04900 [Candidatus Riflebacteria bacterium]|nr:hypothetical protein [Candidatus Riflebacteria bacterium]